MIQTETSKAKILIVEVPNYGEFTDLPQGNWTILNTLDEVTEDEAALIAEIDPEIDFENTATRERLPTYIDYMDDGEYYLSPKNSIKSLATSLGVEGKTIILYQLK